MTWAPFKMQKSETAPAAVAAIAALHTALPQSAANAASAAGGTRENVKFPVPLDEVAALHARTVARLMNAAGLVHAEAERRAVAMVAATLRNDPRLVPHQNDPLKCLVCGGTGREGSPLLPILTPKQWVNLWLCRSECHTTFRQQQSERVAELMRSALPASTAIARP